MLLSVVVLLLPIFSCHFHCAALLHSLSILFCRGGTRNEPYALASRKELKSRTRALWNLVAAVVVADDFADACADASAAVVAARAMHKHAHAHAHMQAGRQTEPRCVTFCCLGCLCLSPSLPRSLPAIHQHATVWAAFICFWIIIVHSAGRRLLSPSLPLLLRLLMSGPSCLCVCVCVGLISA